MKNLGYTLFFLLMISTLTTNAQHKKINWISFKQLEDSLLIKPKKVFISFYADWCNYCKKMDNTGFKNREVIQLLNEQYYSIKMDAESKDSIFFEGRAYINEQLGQSRRPTHKIALLLASRQNKPFSLPATIILDENFKITERYFEYLSPKKMIHVLR